MPHASATPPPEDTLDIPKVLEKPHLGTVLVVGGCGFLGQHVVKFLLQEPTCDSVAVMSRSPFKNRFEDVTYHIGDITNPQHVDHVMNLVKPKVIINTASPHAYIDHEHAGDNFRVNVDGNQCLLDAAAQVGTVKAFVYTSSAPIIAGTGGAYDHADETHPTLAVTKKGDPYHVAKALGDRLTLDANGKNGILTACIRPTALYGEGDSQMIPTVIKVLEDGQTNIWMGYNDVDMDVVYVGHVAKAEVLAALGLLRCHIDPKAPRIDGQAFNITDDQVSQPWTFFRKYWLLAGDTTPLSRVWKFPPWLVMLMAHVAEWFAWILSAGKSRPQFLKVERMEFVLLTRTYNISKARQLLGFTPWEGQPHANQEEALKGSVDWYLHPDVHGPAKLPGTSLWPETPFTLIRDTGAKSKPGLPQDHYCITNARIMATTHNTIFRALNAICHQALDIHPGTQDAADFLAYCSVVFEFMHHHHIMEEKHYFPDLEKIIGIKGLMDRNIEQHLQLETHVAKLMKYAETTHRDHYDGQHLLAMITMMARLYEVHMHEEIGTILELHSKIGSADLKSVDAKMRGEAERFSDVFKYISPFPHLHITPPIKY
ncbi:hypothetical protein HYFRA_00008162 [Hymenoscyphus fraxineus]|uniref:Uncharacterized protein n=1 Tax=Hymenoscyphus fraxineus TaxID=746836 RepID=A0A9N9PYW9_9HELO|nr:hypothetical protein HYFRA_00008162 [Hymenoscyphus fraxineus]